MSYTYVILLKDSKLNINNIKRGEVKLSNIVIGIEGLVASGKSTIAKNLLNKIENSILINGGGLYRAIIYVMLKNGKNLKDLEKNLTGANIKQVMDLLGVEIKIENRETVFYVDDQKIEEDDLNSASSSIAVSKIGGMADNTKLFEFAREFIDNLKQKFNIILTGRALMIIYPEMDYHFFVEADIDVRVERRQTQYKDMSKEQIKAHLQERDKLQEEAGFYKIYPNTIKVDVTNCNTIEESTNTLLSKILNNR